MIKKIVIIRKKEKIKYSIFIFLYFLEKMKKNIIPTFCGNVMLAFFNKKNVLNN